MTVVLDNTGTADATGVEFFAPLPAGLSLSAFAIDGTPGDFVGAPVATALSNTARSRISRPRSRAGA